jgi:hypothetical protein
VGVENCFPVPCHNWIVKKDEQRAWVFYKD